MAKTINNVLVKNLVEFGLGEKEATIYLALLELEIATASKIAETTDINRSSTYVVLESLKAKGLVSFSEDKNIQQYIATSPDMLLFDAQNKAQKAQDVKNNINDIIPELKALHKDTKQKPKVRVFEGKQGLINAMEDTLINKDKVIRVASCIENLFKALPDYFPSYLQKRQKLGIKLRGIFPAQKKQEHFKIVPKLDNIIFISPKKYMALADMLIYDHKIAYISLEKGGVSIIIDSKEISDAMKNMFDLAYKEAERLNKIGNLITNYKKSLDKYKEKTL